MVDGLFLSNIWSAGFGQVSKAVGESSANEIAKAQEDLLANEELGNVGGAIVKDAMDVTLELFKYQTEIALTTLVLSILSIIALFLMWNLKKAGFYLYLVANLSLIFVPAMFVGFNWVSILAMGAGGFFGIVFMILYAVNLKHMD